MAVCGGPIEEGGYQYDYIEDPPETLQCPICLLPCREPHILDCCGKKFCKSCIDRVEYAGQPCPLCRKYFQKLIDRDHERRILELRVHCNFHGGGCEWQGELRHIEPHLRGECHYVPVSCKYGCGHNCIRKDMVIHEDDVCDLRPLELKLIKKVEALERKVEVLEEQCTNQDNLIREQREMITQQADLLKGQKEAFEGQQKVVATNKEEMVKAVEVIKEREETINGKVDQVGEELKIHKEEQQRQCKELLQKIKELEESIENQFKASTELFDKAKKEFDERFLAQQDTHAELQKNNEAINVDLEDQIKTINDTMHKQIQEVNDQMKTQLADRKNFVDQKFNQLEESRAAQMEGLKNQLKKTEESLKKEMDTSTANFNEFQTTIDKRITEAKNLFIPKAVYEKHFDHLKKMSAGFRVPEWQRPLPLTTFSNVPPCQFTMMHFTRHKDEGKAWYSPPFYSEPGGYKLCLRIDPNGMLEGKESHLSVWVYVMKGRFDDSLKWPFTGKITVQLLNWISDRGHIQNIVSFDDAAGDKVRARVTSGKYAATGRGSSKFVPHAMLRYNREKNTDFSTDDCLCFKISKVELH